MWDSMVEAQLLFEQLQGLVDKIAFHMNDNENIYGFRDLTNSLLQRSSRQQVD